MVLASAKYYTETQRSNPMTSKLTIGKKKKQKYTHNKETKLKNQYSMSLTPMLIISRFERSL